MKRVIVAIVLLTLTTSAHATPPPPLASTLEPGAVLIGWGNSANADTVVVVNPSNTACLVPTMERIIAFDTQVATQIPNTTDERCLLRPGDRIYLLLYRDGIYLDEIGPYIVPVRVALPIIR